MSYQQFMWGLSNGVLVLTMAGGFWLGIIGSIVHRPEILGPAGIIGLVLLLWGFVCLRRKSAGFSLAEMKNGTEEQRSSLRQVRRGLRWAMLIEMVLCSIAVGSVEYLHRLDLIWPALGIAVSLHFLPLGRLFRVSRYYFTGIAGTLVCLVAIVAFNAPANALFAAGGMCLNMWGTAAWLLAGSDQMAARAIEESATAAAKA
jgi:hypothetical protein